MQTKRYDEVIEEYRHSIYSLRRLILQGTAQQRTQVCVWGGGEDRIGGE